MSTKKIYKSDNNKVLAGVCGGIADYFDTDPVVIRIIWVLLTIFTGFFPGLLAYLISAAIMPKASQMIKK